MRGYRVIELGLLLGITTAWAGNGDAAAPVPATRPTTQPVPDGAGTQPATSVRPEVQGKLPTKYAYHQLAVWTFDKKTRALAGFAKGEVAPGGRAVLESVKGHAITFTLGRVKKVEVWDEPGGKRRLEPMVEFKMAHGTGSLQGSLALDEPKFSVEYGLGEPVASVVAMIPVGSLPAKTAAAIPTRLNVPGRPEELDDVLLGSASVGLLSLCEAVEVYGVTGRTTRPQQWRQIMADKDADIATIGAAVLARVGDDAGTRRFCKLCLESRGNEQVWLVEHIPQMPPSAAMLDAMVQLITADRTYMAWWGPNVGVNDMDRRIGLLESLFAKYTPGQVKPYAPRLIAWAKGRKDATLPKRIEQFVSAPVPATQPATTTPAPSGGSAQPAVADTSTTAPNGASARTGD